MRKLGKKPHRYIGQMIVRTTHAQMRASRGRLIDWVGGKPRDHVLAPRDCLPPAPLGPEMTFDRRCHMSPRNSACAVP